MQAESQWASISEWMKQSTKVFIKKLSRNDSSWANQQRGNGERSNNQNGVYIPARALGFFPAPSQSNPEKPHILFAEFLTLWPALGQTYDSRLAYYTNKSSETQLTRLPKDEFADLTPASLLVGGQLRTSYDGIGYWFFVVDSESEDAERLEALFEIGVDFRADVFDSSYARSDRSWEMQSILDEIGVHLSAGTLSELIRTAKVIPGPREMALAAQDHFMKYHQIPDLNPFKMGAPGDVIMRISREIEYRKYKEFELRHRAAEVIHVLQNQGTADLVQAVVRGFAELDGIFLSATQHRRSRAGQSFEHHIARMLRDGRIRHEAQKVTGSRRPDFVLPTLYAVRSSRDVGDEVILLSAKTTLRERWKQLSMERFECGRFLATVDDRVSSDAIDEMAKEGICLVVPESLKSSEEICYREKSNVITFHSFFHDEIAKKRPSLIDAPVT